MTIDNTKSEYYLTYGRKNGDVFSAIDPSFRSGLNGWMIVGSVGGDNRAGVAFGFPVQNVDGVYLIPYPTEDWRQLEWQFIDPDGEFFKVESGHLILKLENRMTLGSGSFEFKLEDDSEVEGTFRLLRS
ncbi:hypothetical protein [Pseudomonas frederiksbergensis]|uniref:Uncharacterized protein n=1 Tax=Pseudomonas frederiksbergensis TaxID=104087 RepID=A0A423KLC2_9PSED|nr:hypothetical protein [Pseudomonas frederiksbergensis]RON54687.1 hypothetical protein BK665_10185 [Pseudomonas frederiksbergensis]